MGEGILDARCSNSITMFENPLAKLEAWMERLKKPSLEWNFMYYKKVGLHGIGVNPHRLKFGRNVHDGKLVVTFGKMNMRLGFHYMGRHDSKINIIKRKWWFATRLVTRFLNCND